MTVASTEALVLVQQRNLASLPLKTLIQPHELHVDKVAIGLGPFGKTFRAQWDKITVTVYKITKKLNKREEHSFLDQASKIRTINHPNVLKLYGVVRGGPKHQIKNWALVMEFVHPCRLLHNLLHGERERFGDDDKKLTIALMVANTMVYLHDRDIIHGDLNPYTVYVTNDNTVKINIFSFQSALDMTYSSAVRYTAVCDEGRQSKQLDVFSFGVLLWELFTEQTPFADISNPFQVAAALYEGRRPPLDDPGFPSLGGREASLKELLARCWDQSAKARPQFTEIVKDLTHLMSGVEEGEAEDAHWKK